MTLSSTFGTMRFSQAPQGDPSVSFSCSRLQHSLEKETCFFFALCFLPPFAFIIMTQDALRPLFEARHFGSSHQTLATGELRIFGHHTWCTDGAAIENDGSFQGLYEQCTGIGAPEFDLSSWWSTALILLDAADLYQVFCFRFQ
jgi:hypothetical protein